MARSSESDVPKDAPEIKKFVKLCFFLFFRRHLMCAFTWLEELMTPHMFYAHYLRPDAAV